MRGMMKDLIRGIEEIINKHQQKFLDDVGEALVDEERLATSIAESLVVDEGKFIGECQWFWEENENGNNDGTLEELYKAISKGDILKCKGENNG